ncbi:NAD(P)H-dependent glycerol-3-phosphate dehydrogenase [Marivita sp.]|uniref:NAD(P)H-dependent glycerol-3-phosphate dehydrogenase n=1 Tax=Marivita sp. TaxID=2003365 RepID=UPI003F6C2872
MRIDRQFGESFPRSAHPYKRLAVIGAGAYGTALAHVIAQDGTQVSLWARDEEVAGHINRSSRNAHYLPDIILAPSITATHQLKDALRDADAVMIVVPSHAIRSVARAMRPYILAGIPITVCAKGIEADTGCLMSQIVEDELPGHTVGALSGPTFATELAAGHPSAATLAFSFDQPDRLDPENSAAARMAMTLATPAFRTYLSDDLVGVEIGGAVKNVIAIACGMMRGAGFAENTRAALITRGLDEMKALAEALGGRRETVTGLSGIGDLTLTCSSTTSRNMSLGVQLGSGLERDACFDGKRTIVEGEANAKSVTDLAHKLSVPMPICETVCGILHDGLPIAETFARFWAEPIESEPRAMSLTFAHPAPLSTTPAFKEIPT